MPVVPALGRLVVVMWIFIGWLRALEGGLRPLERGLAFKG